jgi:transcriptional regulator with XRE-family HTH domain
MGKYPNRIKELRHKLGYTQQELGNKFAEPKDITVISRWERGVVKPSAEHLLELANALNEDPNKIFLNINKTDKSVFINSA